MGRITDAGSEDRRRRVTILAVRLVLVLVLLALALLGGAVWLAGPGEELADHRETGEGKTGEGAGTGKAASGPGFVGSETCKKCHENEHGAWLKTAHAYSLREATDEYIKGQFDGQPIRHKHFVATPIRRVRADTGEVEFLIRVRGNDGRPDGDHKVTHIVGRAIEQAYLTTDETGGWRILPLCWSIERKEWDLTHQVLSDIAGSAHGVDEDYDTRERVFNHGCGQCHATNYQVGHTTHPDRPATYASTYLEGAVACESCHGPGTAHVAWHREDRPVDPSYSAPARLVHPKEDLDPQQISASCGRCHYSHAWRFAIDDDPLVGHEEIAVTLNLDRPGFFADGRLAGLQYHGTVQSQSRCYTEGGMSCLSCHSLHSGRRFALKWKDESTQQQCLQCHQEIGEQGESHTKHAPEAATCVDCHMPKHLMGVLHFMRDHMISVPEPELTDEFGARTVPNACNECHTDQTAAWAREWKERWWKPAPKKLVQNVRTVVTLRRDRLRVPLATLATMAKDRANRSFFRHTALSEIARRTRRATAARDLLRGFLDDPDTEILQLTCDALGEQPDPAAVPRLLKLTRHKVRTIRVEALYAAVRAGWRLDPGDSGDKEFQERVLRVYADVRQMLHRQRAFATSLMRIAMIADGLGRYDDMERAYIRMVRESGASGWPPAMTDLTHRRGRIRAYHGKFKSALEHYKDARRQYGDPAPPLLALDSADAVAGLGNHRSAAVIWRALARQHKGTPIAAIATARLEAEAGRKDAARTRLRTLEEELAKDPAMGNMRARIATALSRIGR